MLQLLATLEHERTDAAHRAAEAGRDRQFLAQLELIRTKVSEKDDPDKIDARYSVAFRDFGIDPDQLDPNDAGRLLKSRSEPLEFALFLDDWTLIRRAALGDKGKDSWRRLIAAARATDPDPWRDELRMLIDGGKHEAVHRMAANQAALEAQPARSLYLLAQALELSRDGNHGDYLKESVEILERAWRISPDDYQISSTLGHACEREIDKIRFCTAAVSAKPKSTLSHYFLATAFLRVDRDGNLMWAFVTRVPGKEKRESTAGPGKEKPNSELIGERLWGLNPADNETIRMGPVWGFDPNSLKAENLGDAAAEYAEAIRLDPSDPDYHRAYADVLILQGNIERAITEFRAACSLRPQDARLHEQAAHRFYLIGRLDLALAELQEAVRLKPLSEGLNTRLLLGNTYHELGEKRQAFAAYREALLTETDSGGMLTRALLATGTSEDVAAAYRDAIRLQPKNPEHHMGLAKLLCASDHREEAIAEFHEAIRLKANDPAGYNDFAWDLATLPEAKQRDGKSAVEFATKACELTQWKNSVYLDTLSAAFAEVGEFDTAVKWQIKAIELLSDEEEREDYRTRLRLYQQKKPYRVPVPER